MCLKLQIFRCEFVRVTYRLAIPLGLKLNAIGWPLREVLDGIDKKKGTICDVSKASFHEIRSLSARLYEEEKGAEFAQKILGHKSMQMTDRYLDDRGNGYTEL